MLTTAPSIEPQAMLTIVATAKLLVASRAKLDAMLGPRKKAVLEIEQGDVLEAAPTIALKIGPKRMMGTASKAIPRVVLKVAPRFALEAGPTIAPRLVLGVGPTVMRRPLPIRNSMLPVRKTSPVL
ncbi:hypothetical protein [uncultured Slackia sp.]|uniref:hypothetical protein n=1 Tax=uncultured Slackia sp. TaxID=665903 RepID=UPI0026769AC1|nr:hypothetical protein [uncultured Slackia sp.]